MASEKIYNAEMTGLLILLSVCTSCFAGLPVPLLSWGYGDSSISSSSEILSGHTMDAAEVFQNNLQPYTENGHVLFVFLQDELSVDDFTKYSSSFKHLENILQKETSTVFPSVSQRKQSILSLLKDNSKLVEVFGSDLSSWTLNNISKDANVVLFHLEPVADSSLEGKNRIFQQNDNVIHEILKQIKLKKNNFGVVYTAEQPSESVTNLLVNEQLDKGSHSLRQLLEKKNNEQALSSGRLFNNSGIAYLYLKHLKFGDVNNPTELLNGTDEHISGSACSTSTCSINVKIKEAVGNITSFDMLLEMNIDNATGAWHCSLITVKVAIKNEAAVPDQTYQCGPTNTSSDFESTSYSVIQAPMGMSFSCHDMVFVPNRTEYTLSLGGLQLQPHIEKNAFGNAYHCVGFFSLEILTGLVVAIILFVGLLVGIMMMMNIQVQDRFDDPKGQTISVPTQD